jgi:hypothetical protein
MFGKAQMGNAGSVYYDTRSELMWFRMDGQALTTNIECRHNLSNRNYMSASQPVTTQTHHKQTATGKVITQWLNRQVHPSEASIDVCDETRSLETRSSSIDRPQVQCLLFC